MRQYIFIIFFFDLALRTTSAYYASMNKQRTNIYLPADIKKKAFDLANKGGLSLSAYITQLILRECAIADGRIKGNLAIFTKTNKK